MFTTKQKETCRYGKQTSGYQRGEGRSKRGAGDKEKQTIMRKIDDQQGYIEQHSEV